MASSPRTVLFFSVSIFTPMNSRPRHAASRVLSWFSPTPPVKRITSTPPIAAAYEPIYLRMRYSYMLSASVARGWPASTAAQISRMSEDTPETPCTPDFLLSRFDTPVASKPSFSMMKVTAPPSMSPLRVPIMRPSSGVRPMLVSTHLPSTTAEIDAPLPMWQVMILVPSGLMPR